jgi:predicted transposase/invertase (TIGR01784 family)
MSDPSGRSILTLRRRGIAVTGIAHPHDRFFKVVMTHPEAAAALLRERLPRELVGMLADEPPRPLDASFIDDHLRGSASDRLFSLRLSEGESFVNSLIEHKSTPDPDVAFQLLRYMVRIWEGTEREGGAARKKPPIIPMVVYHGAAPWKVPKSFLGLVDPCQGLGSRLLDFEMTVVDLGEIDDDCLSRNPTLHAGLLELKYATRASLQRAKLGMILGALRLVPWLVQAGVVYILETFESIDRAFLLGEVRRVMPEYEDVVMSIAAQEWKAEWKAEGKQEALMRILERRFGPLPEETRLRIVAATAGQIDAWIDRAIDAPALGAVFDLAH